MDSVLENTSGFFDALAESFAGMFTSLSEVLDLLQESISLPLRLTGYMPTIIGASISIVLFTMVIKFIIGR